VEVALAFLVNFLSAMLDAVGVILMTRRRTGLMRKNPMEIHPKKKDLKTTLKTTNLMRKNLMRTHLMKTNPMKTNRMKTSRTRIRARPRASARPRLQHTSLHSVTSSQKLQGQQMDLPPLPHLALFVLPRRNK
jgi:hypothetical protein